MWAPSGRCSPGRAAAPRWRNSLLFLLVWRRIRTIEPTNRKAGGHHSRSWLKVSEQSTRTSSLTHTHTHTPCPCCRWLTWSGLWSLDDVIPLVKDDLTAHEVTNTRSRRSTHTHTHTHTHSHTLWTHFKIICSAFYLLCLFISLPVVYSVVVFPLLTCCFLLLTCCFNDSWMLCVRSEPKKSLSFLTAKIHKQYLVKSN